MINFYGNDYLSKILEHATLDELTQIDQHLCAIQDQSMPLSEYIKAAWSSIEPGTEYVHGWHLDAIAEHLTAVTDDQITRLIINVPPGTMKSLMTCVLWPSWEWGVRQLDHYRIISTSHKEELALRDCQKMRRLVMSEWYQAQFAHVQLRKDQNKKSKYETQRGGFREACAADSLTGSRGDRLIIDDPISALDGRSKAVLQSRETWFAETVPTRLVSPIKSAIVLIMQRLSELDTTGAAIARDLGYELLMLPMEYEPKRRCFTSIGFADPRTEDNELLFPERFPRAVVERDKKAMGEYAVAGQLQQRPAPEGGGIIKASWWCYFTPEYNANRQVIKPGFEFLVQSWDTAFKEGETNDYCACTTWGVNNAGAYLIYVIRKKMDFPKLLETVKDHAAEYNPNIILVEDAASGQSLIQSLKKETRLPIKAVKADRDKETRLSAVSTFIESGRVFLLAGANWLKEYTHELETFPGAAHDDLVDSTSQALAHIFLKTQAKRLANVNLMGR